MKRNTFLLFFLSLLMLFVPSKEGVTAQSEITVEEVTVEMLETDPVLQLFQHNWLNLFPINTQKNDFKVKQPEQRLYIPFGDLTTQVDNDVQYVTLSVTPDGVTERDGMLRIQGAGGLENFFLTMKIKPSLVEPIRYGGCYLGYLNETTGRKIFLGIMNGSPYVEVWDKNSPEGTRYRIKMVSDIDEATLTLIRFLDTSYVLVNDRIVRRFKDGDDGKFQLIYGPVLYRDGTISQCTFDDLYLRKGEK